jgi:hypothetical protein
VRNARVTQDVSPNPRGADFAISRCSVDLVCGTLMLAIPAPASELATLAEDAARHCLASKVEAAQRALAPCS